MDQVTAEGVRHACQRRPNLVLLNDFDDIVDWVQIQASDWLVDRHLVAQVKLGNRFAVFFSLFSGFFFGRQAEVPKPPAPHASPDVAGPLPNVSSFNRFFFSKYLDPTRRSSGPMWQHRLQK